MTAPEPLDLDRVDAILASPDDYPATAFGDAATSVAKLLRIEVSQLRMERAGWQCRVRMAQRHASECDVAVAEAEERLAVAKADIARHEALGARRHLVIYDLKAKLEGGADVAAPSRDKALRDACRVLDEIVSDYPDCPTAIAAGITGDFHGWATQNGLINPEESP